jgi:hypothetical protein
MCGTPVSLSFSGMGATKVSVNVIAEPLDIPLLQYKYIVEDCKEFRCCTLHSGLSGGL